MESYTLDVAPADQVGDQKVVGGCEGWSKKTVYKRS
jgi:hypothetical protein